MIGQIKGVAAAAVISAQYGAREAAEKEQKTASPECGEAYVIELESKSSGKKGSGALSTEEMERIREQADQATQSLRDLVEKLFLKQQSTSAASIRLSISGTGETDAETAAQAQEMISEDGQFGVKAVSDRIVAFAKAISGNDTDKLPMLKQAIEKGFAMAGKTFGGDLPGICGETYDEVMRKLDQWSEGEQSPAVDITA